MDANEMMNFHNKYSYKIEEAVKSNRKRCVPFFPFSFTIRHWFGVTGSHDMEANEMMSFHNKYSYKIKEAVKSSEKRCVLCDQCGDTIRH